jgi:hypothetical protein
MEKSFRVMDLRQADPEAVDAIIDGASPEEAARKVLGIEVVRSGSKRDLVAKVYWQPVGQPLTMVRLYARIDDGGRRE